MSKQTPVTTPHLSGLGEPAYSAFEKLSSNDDELYSGANILASPAASALTGAELFPAMQGGVLKKVTGSSIVNGITALTGDVTASGPGSAAATIAAGAVTLAKQANLAANSIIGNNTGSPATPLALAAAQVAAFVGADITAATYAAARLLVGTAGSRLQLLGRTAQSDGGQGLFTWVAGGTTTVDEGVELTATGGIWRRADYSLNLCNVKWFGAKGDGTTDDKLAIQKAVDALQAVHGGIVYFPYGKYRITGPIITGHYGPSFRGDGAARAIYNPFVHTALYLDSSTTSDYAIKLGDASTYESGKITISDIAFQGTNSGSNQGGILIAGSIFEMSVERCSFAGFTGYAIGRDPTIVLSYTQSNAFRDVSFHNCGGAYGLISEPANAAAFLAESVVLFSNINVDDGINSTAPKAHIFDFRGSWYVHGDTFISEGACPAGVTSVMAFAADTEAQIELLYMEHTGTPPTYSIYMYDDVPDKFRGHPEGYVRIGTLAGELKVRFADSGTEQRSVVEVGYWDFGNATAITDLVSFEGTKGTFDVKRLRVTAPFVLPEAYFGRVKLGVDSRVSYMRANVRQGSMLLFDWDGSKGALDNVDCGQAWMTKSTTASDAVEADGATNLKVHRFTGLATSGPFLEYKLDLPAAWSGAIAIMAIRYRCTVLAGDVSGGTVFNSVYGRTADGFGEIQIINGAVMNNTDYVTGYVFGRLNGTAPTIEFRSQITGTAPTVAIVLRIQSMRIWLGIPDDLTLAPALGIAH